MLAACGQTQVATPRPAGAPINAGAVLSLTGSQSLGGQMAKEGYLFCQNWINAKGGILVRGVGHPLNIDMLDDESRPSIAAAETEQLISQNHPVLFGATNDATAARAAQVAEQHQIPLISSGAASDGIFGNHYHYVFSVLAPASTELQGVIDMALRLNPRPQSVALLFSSDSLSAEVAYATAAYAQAKGLNVVYGTSYPSGVNDLYTQLGSAQQTGPDILLAVGHPADSVRTVVQARRLDFQPKLLAFNEGPGTGTFVADLHSVANYSFGTTQWTPAVRNRQSYFLDSFHYALAYQAQFGHLPDANAAAATAACLTAEVAIEEANSTVPRWIRDALGVVDLRTFFGEIKFDERGVNIAKPVYVQQVQAGQTVLVWPANVASAHPRYPDPGWGKH